MNLSGVAGDITGVPGVPGLSSSSQAHSRTGAVTVAGLSKNRSQGFPAWALVLIVLLLIVAVVAWFWLKG